MKAIFVKDILNTRFYAILIAVSSDASILEQKVLYLFFLSSGGVPVPTFLNVDTPEHAHTDDLNLAQVFSGEYCEIFKNSYFEKHLQMAASGS